MAGTLRRRVSICLPAAAAALAFAPAARAASLTVDYSAKKATYTADAPEVNQLSIALDTQAGTYRFSDPGAAAIGLTVKGATSANSCSQSGGVVTCTAANLSSAGVSLGDGDDTLWVTGSLAVTVDGGSGSDTLHTGSGADTLNGGSGDDTLIGGAGPDVFNGGDGVDTIDWSSATAPVSAQADGLANDGEAGEDDTMGSDIESVIGGSGDDSLHAGPNGGTVQGGPGDDTVKGDAGADVLNGGPGVDSYMGKGGNDVIVSRDNVGGEDIDCGNGTDSVVADPGDSFWSNCENVDTTSPADGTGTPTPTAPTGDGSGSTTGGGGDDEVPTDPQGNPIPAPDILLPVRPVAFAAPNALQVKLGCSTDAAGPCRGDIYVSVPARYVVRRGAAHKLHAARGHFVAQTRRIAHRKFRIRRGKTLTARVHVALRGHYILRNRRRIHGKLRVVQRDAAGKVLGVTTRPIVLDRKWSRRNRRS